MKSVRKITASKKIMAYTIIITFVIISLYMTEINARNTFVSISSTDSPTVSITVKDAFYGDADGDGKQDDVIAYIEHNFTGATRYQLDVYPTLILPSGDEYTWYYTLNTRLSSVTVIAYFYNHALESGNYTLTIDAFLKTGGISHAQDSHIFDPPGGKGDNPPDFSVSIA